MVETSKGRKFFANSGYWGRRQVAKNGRIEVFRCLVEICPPLVKHKRKEDWDFRGMKDIDYHKWGRCRKMEEDGGRKRRKRTGGRRKMEYSKMEEYGGTWKRWRKKEEMKEDGER